MRETVVKINRRDIKMSPPAHPRPLLWNTFVVLVMAVFTSPLWAPIVVFLYKQL